MTFNEELHHFFNEFAVDFSATLNGKTILFKGLLDEDDELIGESGTNSKSTKYIATCITSEVAFIKRSNEVKQGQDTYKVREPVMKLDDGAFSEVYLTKIAG